MQSARDRKIATKKFLSVIPRDAEYPFRLNFYGTPPLYHVTIEEFETCALERLRVLAEIESSFARNRPWEDMKKFVTDQCKKHYPLDSSTAKFVDIRTQRKRDHIGHYVLRLAFCRSEDLRRRFVKAETTLFKIRFDMDDSSERQEFLDSLHGSANKANDKQGGNEMDDGNKRGQNNSEETGWEEITKEEFDEFEEELRAAHESTLSPRDPPLREAWRMKHYKVKWMRVPDLVEKRKVFLHKGKAYVPETELSSIIFQQFQDNLEKSLLLTLKHLPRLDEDTRIIPLLNNLSQGFLAGVPSEWCSATSSANGDEITADMIDGMAKQHFPMCMRHLHESVRKDKHLKHFGRLQYGLFLKVLGLSIEEALAFWRRSFSLIQDDKFNKEYKYNIRHTFGLEGKRANYPAKSCQQILTADQPGPQDSHGCPYRHFSIDNLQTGLLSMYSSQGLSSAHLPEIVSIVKAGHYHVACTRVFEITHAAQGVKKNDGVGEGESVTHPNQYAARSLELEKMMKKEEEDVNMG